MAHLVPMTLDDGTVIYIQANDSVEAPVVEVPIEGGGRMPKGPTRGGGVALEQSVESLQSTIKHYTRHILSAFEGGPVTPMGGGSIEKVTLEFGVTVAGQAGIPYITEASAEGSLKVTVECAWPKES
ncbi:MAG: CU044_2847 family protein [Phormidesmis sp.]